MPLVTRTSPWFLIRAAYYRLAHPRTWQASGDGGTSR